MTETMNALQFSGPESRKKIKDAQIKQTNRPFISCFHILLPGLVDRRIQIHSARVEPWLVGTVQQVCFLSSQFWASGQTMCKIPGQCVISSKLDDFSMVEYG